MSKARTVVAPASSRTSGDGRPGVPSRTARSSEASAAVHQLADQAPDRAARQPGLAREVGPRQRAMLVQTAHDRAQIRATHGLASQPGIESARLRQRLCSFLSNLCQTGPTARTCQARRRAGHRGPAVSRGTWPGARAGGSILATGEGTPAPAEVRRGVMSTARVAIGRMIPRPGAPWAGGSWRSPLVTVSGRMPLRWRSESRPPAIRTRRPSRDGSDGGTGRDSGPTGTRPAWPGDRRGPRPCRGGRGRDRPRRGEAMGDHAVLPAHRGPPGVVGRATLGRGAAGRDPARAAGPDRPRPQPVPHVRRDVGRLGGLRPDGDGLLRQGEAERVGRRGGQERGDQLRGLPRPDRALHQERRGGPVAVRVRERDGRAVLPARRHHDRRRHAGRARQPDRGGGHRRGARRTARTRRTGTPRRTTSR